MSADSNWRPILEEYFAVTKEFYDMFYTKTVIDEMSLFFKEFLSKDENVPLPSRLAEAERLGLENLLDSLSIIGRALTNLEKWRDWGISLIYDLKLTNDDIPLLSRGENIVLKKIRAQDLDEGFVRWILGTAITDFIEILAETKEILTHVISLQSFGHQLNSPWLLFICQIIGQLQEPRHDKRLEDMQKALNEAYYAPDHESRIKYLATFLYLFTKWQLDLTPQNVEVDDPRWIIKMIEKAGGQVDRIKTITQRMRTLLKTRNAVYYYFQQAELSVIRMMLGYKGNPEQWWLSFLNTPQSRIPKLIPKELDPKELLIGVSHSLSLHEDLEHHLIPQSPVFIATFKQIAEFLQSPIFDKYCQLSEYRLSIWDQYRKQWNRLLAQLQRELQKQKQVAQHKVE